MNKIIQMDLFQRVFANDKSAFVGIVYCENGEFLEEGPAYLFDMATDTPAIYSEPLLPSIESRKRFSVDDSLQSQDWLPTHQTGVSLVRLFKLGRGDRGFIAFGVNNSPLVDNFRTDAIISYRDGNVKTSLPHRDLGNYKMGTLLQKLHCWSNLNGETILPVPISTEAKNIIVDIDKKRVDVARGIISIKDFNEWALQDPDRLFLKKFHKEDPLYLQYLLQMDEAGLLNKNLEWMTVQEKNQFNYQESIICQNVIKPFESSEPANDPGP